MNAAPRTPAPRIPALAFPLAAAGVFATVLALAHWSPAASRPGPLAWGILADLLLTVPALWYLLVVRGRGASPHTLFPIAIACFAVARFLLPPEVRPAKLSFEIVVALAEVAALVFLVRAVRRGIRHARTEGAALEAGPGSLPERLSLAAREIFGFPRLAGFFAAEVATLVYAFAGPWLRPPASPRAFSIHRESGWSAAVVGLLLAMLVEAFPVHALALRVHPGLAWGLSLSTLYAMLWLIGDYQALRIRPVMVGDDELHVRVGLRAAARIPWSNVREIREARRDDPGKGRGVLRGILIGDPGVIVELHEAQPALGPFGIPQRIERVALAPDDRRGFLAAAREAAARANGDAGTPAGPATEAAPAAGERPARPERG